ncbi:MAG: FAD:protein FMN transferase [Kiritimatiellales bacterium]|nr:FAD:protein FMN transferase [Kiritimatiellales bacterium]
MYPLSNKRILRLCLSMFILLVLGFLYFNRTQTVMHPRLHGYTMGTTYSITITGRVPRSTLKILDQTIGNTLAEVNRQMSTWDPASEISAFNQSGSTEPFPVSAPFAKVVQAALGLSDTTGGAFDPTLNPLLNLWGFGSRSNHAGVPPDDDVERTRAACGWRHLHAETASAIRKDIPGLQLDLGAIAKGYGVDAVAADIRAAGLANYFVEIGGEVYVEGTNPDGVPWRIGVQLPSTGPVGESLQGIINIHNRAVATSGDYRNYIEKDGVIYSHIMDPRTGRPALHNVASVTVLAPSCMEADGMATGLFVMGAEKGLEWVENHPGVEALFLLHDEKDEIIEKFSSGFKSLTDYSVFER